VVGGNARENALTLALLQRPPACLNFAGGNTVLQFFMVTTVQPFASSVTFGDGARG